MEFIGIDKYISQFSILSFHAITLSLSLFLSILFVEKFLLFKMIISQRSEYYHPAR